MRTIVVNRFVMIGILFVSTIWAQQERPWWERPPCPELRSASPEALLSFLDTLDRKGNDKPACIADAIIRLGESQYQPAAETLIRYLDFVDPYYDERMKTKISRMPSPWDKYPATGALGWLGKGVEQKVIQAIASDRLSDIARHNATISILLRYGGSEAQKSVALLNNANRASHDAAASRRLLEAAREAVEWCPSESRYLCAAILLDQSGK